MYYGARYYDWVLGRFISADTIVPSATNPQALNRYSYVLNNPLKYTDPSGRVPCGSGSGLQWEDCPVPENGPDRQTFFYAPEIERVLDDALNSPTARSYIDYVRRNRVNFIFGGLADLINPGGLVTRGNTIFISSVYTERVKYHGFEGWGPNAKPILESVPGEPIPRDLLIHEIVHVKQNAARGDRLWPTLEDEREAWTVSKTVYAELRGLDPASNIDTGAQMINGVYTPNPWSAQDWFIYRLFKLSYHYWWYR